MKRHSCARALLAGGISVMALAGGIGVASAQPADPDPLPAPPIIDQLITSTPALWAPPGFQGGPGLAVGRGGAGTSRTSTDWGGVGMYCENPSVRCR
jgi:hypothetical protein